MAGLWALVSEQSCAGQRFQIPYKAWYGGHALKRQWTMTDLSGITGAGRYSDQYMHRALVTTKRLP